MTKSESTNRETVPAAALLFQAPQFLEPPTPAPNRQTDIAQSNSFGAHERENYRGRWKRDVAETADNAREEQNDTRTEFKSRQKTTIQNHRKSGESAGSSPFAENSENSTTRRLPRQTSDTPKDQYKRQAEHDSRNQPVLEQEKTSIESERSKTAEPASYEDSSVRRRRRRTRSYDSAVIEQSQSTTFGVNDDGVQALKGSTRLEAKRIRRRETRRERRRRYSITEAEFLARRESVDRQMVVRHRDGLDQIAVLEDDVLVEHYVANKTQQSIVGNVYLGRVHNVLPSMEAAFVDIGKGRNAVLYAGEVNWTALGVSGNTPRRIESALKPGDTVLVQVTKDAIGHKGARLTSQISLAGRYLVLVPGASTLGISRKLPDSERIRLKKLLRQNLPENAGVIVRTAAEGALEEQLLADIERLSKQWENIQQKQKTTRKAPTLLRSEPELVVRVVRDIFNEDFSKLIVQGKETWDTVSKYVNDLSPELSDRLEYWTGKDDLFHEKRIDQQLAKGMDRKVWLPSGGTLIIDRTEAMTVIDVNTGKFIGSGGTLEETVTRNNLEAAEEIVRQLRLRDIGGMIIIDFVDMVLESNKELVLRRLIECLTRDRTRHQVTEVTSLGLVQMTRKRVGEGLVEAFSTPCEHCEGRGFIVHDQPIDLVEENSHKKKEWHSNNDSGRRQNRQQTRSRDTQVQVHADDEQTKSAMNTIAAATEKSGGNDKSAKPDKFVDTEKSIVDSAKQNVKETRKKRRRVVSAGANTPDVQTIPQKSIEGDLPEVQNESSDAQALTEAVESSASPEVAVVKPARKRRRVVVSAEVVSPSVDSGTASKPGKSVSTESTDTAESTDIVAAPVVPSE